MYRIYLYKATMFAYGTALLVLGIVIIVQRELLMTPLAVIGGTVLLLHGLYNAVSFITKQGKLKAKRKKALLFTAVINTGLGIAVQLLPRQTVRLFIFVFALYVMLNAASKMADFIVMKINRIRGGLRELAAFTIYFVFSLILLLSDMRENAFLVVSGIYCIMLGASNLVDFLYQVFPQKAKNRIKRKIRISLPVFVSTFMPLRTLRKINEYIAVNEEMPDLTIPEKQDGKPPDIEVMVHISNNGAGKIGHLDLYMDGEVISYGNHDWSSHKLFSVFGDGVMFIAEKEPYLEFSVMHDRKMVFSYGFRLTGEQTAAVRQEIEKLKEQTVPWKPPYQTAYEKDKNAKLSDFHDYSSKVWAGTHAEFFKFRKGKFRTYSILSTNCVLLTDEIIGKAGADVVIVNGIVSPGIYYDYLEKQYMTPGSMVISKTIYDRKSVRRNIQERKNNNE